MATSFTPTFSYKLIYVFRINDKAHKDILKIGSATAHTDLPHNKLTPNCKELNKAAKKRIDAYTSTAGIAYELLHTELAICAHHGISKAFLDTKVHRVLKNSGIKQKTLDTARKQNEWFCTDLETAKNAIKAVKEGRAYLGQSEISQDRNPVVFRPEQIEAIEKTVAHFKKSKRMLWNAKMRFGKTLSALEVIKRCKFAKVIIITHRPVVIDSWEKDFNKIFYDTDDYLFGSKTGKGQKLETLVKSKKRYVYFASIQDLRGAEVVGGRHDKNDEVYNTDWDLVIIDEAHEGTKTQLGDNIKVLLFGDNTRTLELSGTPFNLMEDYDEKEIYTWDYVMEQRAKRDWYDAHFGDPNPYEELPELNIFTYSLGNRFKSADYTDLEDKAFNFKEFFRTWTGKISEDKKHRPEGAAIGDFVHKDDVLSFLNLISKADTTNHYPFSTEVYRDYFRHSLWMLPGVKEAKALSTMMSQHAVFGSGAFTIVNVAGAGAGDEEQDSKDALWAVRKAIGEKPETNYTITLSCGRLTTGVSVPEWTAVFMLAGSYSTSAANYMQTIFRVQTPASIGGKLKEKCYVFDFAPDRTLKMVAEASKISSGAGKTTTSDRLAIGEFLNFCPVISIDGTSMRPYDVDGMLQQLKKAYTDRVVRNGFDDPHIYNDELLKLDGLALEDFKDLKKIVGATKQTKKTGDIPINDQGFTKEEHEQLEKAQRKPERERTDEEKRLIAAAKEKRKSRDTAISILRAISIRIPLMVYGAAIPYTDEITADNFTDLIDPLSWDEFMPKGVTKNLFNKFKRYYDPDIFIAAARQIRTHAKSADSLRPTERFKKISSIFATFKNPDKETVLTPWRVVNMHLSDCLGGYDFFDQEHKETIKEPRFVDLGEVTAKTLANADARILEINSKTGLYPLYVAYSLFRKKCEAYTQETLTPKIEAQLWNETVAENVFVICKTPMAQSITKRTLVGYTGAKVNTKHFEDLINQITNKPNNFIKKVVDGKNYWKANNKTNMKFNAVVGNPPYQITKAATSDSPIYHLFMDVAFRLSSIASLLTPARFLFNAGKTPREWNEKILNDEHFKVIWYKSKSTDVFPNVDIKGGVVVTLRDQAQIFDKIGTYTDFTELNSILRKVQTAGGSISVSELIFPQNKFVLLALYGDYPQYKKVIGSSGREKRLTTSIFEQLDVFEVNPQKTVDELRILGLIQNNRVYRYIPNKYIEPHPNLNKYKVLVPKSNGSGAIGEVLSTPLIGTPLIGYTQSFISIGAFDTSNEAEAALKYVKSKFARAMLGILKVTQDNSKEVWKFVPLQDFTGDSDIDWSKSIEDIDKKLYAKYGLDEEEIAFIESKIKPMS